MAALDDEPPAATAGPRKAAFSRLLSDPAAIFGMLTVAVLFLSSAFANVLAPYDPNAIDVVNKFASPSWDHWLGTDQLGRDVLSRVLFGGRVALVVALSATFLGAVLGITFGLIAGYGPRWLDNAIVFLLDSVRSFPMIILALAVGPLFGGGIVTIIAIIGVAAISYYGRIVRTQTLALKNAEFVQSLRSSGASVSRIIFLHILPNIVGPVAILACMDIPIAIAAEAGLSFLGVGVKPPTSSWGLILDDGFKFIHQTPWLAIGGSIPLVLTTLGLTFLGESLRDAYDPRLKGDA